MDFLHRHLHGQAPGLAFVARMANPMLFRNLDENNGLKVAAVRKGV